MKKYACPVPMFESRGEHDSVEGHETRLIKNKANLDFWCQVNGCSQNPEFEIRMDNNYLYFKGEKADVIYRDVKARGHGQTFDDADIVWRKFFSGLSRHQGEIVRTTCREPASGDKNAVVFADGCSKIYKDNRILSVDGPKPYVIQDQLCYPDDIPDFILEKFKQASIEFAPVLYVSIPALCQAFDLQWESDGEVACVILPDGRSVQFSAGNIGCICHNQIYSMSRQAEFREGSLFIPVKWFAAMFLNRFVIENRGVLYITDHYGEMTWDMAELMKNYLK